MGDLSKAYEQHKAKLLKAVMDADLPDWIPDADVKLINIAISDFIEQGFQAEDVGGWVCDDTDVPLERLSPILVEHLFYLIKVKRALIQGERQGIPLLLGGEQTHRLVKLTGKAFGARGGKGKRGQIGPVKLTLKRIVEGIGSAQLEDVLDAIEDERAADICETYENPTPVIFDDVNRHHETVTYVVRGTGKNKTITFGTLNNHLTAFR